jgi:hypothetical protein
VREAPITATAVDSLSADWSLKLPRRLVLAVLSAAALLATTIPAAGASALPGARVSAEPQDLAQAADYPGIQHLHFRYGPVAIQPGQNSIEAHPNDQRPSVPGFITRSM